MALRDVLLLLLPVVAGCGDDLPELRWEGEYVALATPGSVQPCGGTLDSYDRFVVAAHDFLGFSTPSDFQARVYWLEWDGFYERTPCSTGACTTGATGDVYIADMSQLHHELAHTVVVPQFGTTTPLLEEGLAEALGGLQLPSFEPDPSVILLDDHSTDVDYQQAAGFVRMLVEMHGAGQFFDLYEEAATDPEAAFASVLGQPFDEARDAYGSNSSACLYHLPACSAPVAKWDGTTFEVDRFFRCEQPDVVGFATTDANLAASKSWAATLDIMDAGEYSITTSHELLVFDCDSCMASVVTPSEQPQSLSLQAGHTAIQAIDGSDVIELVLTSEPEP